MDRWDEEFEDFKFNSFYKKMSIITIGLSVLILFVFIFTLNIMFRSISKLENRMQSLEEYVSSTYNTSLEEINQYIDENTSKSDDVDNESEKSSKDVSENSSAVSSSIEASDEAKSENEDKNSSTEVSLGTISNTKSTSLNSSITVTGYFDSVEITDNSDGTKNYKVIVSHVNGTQFLLQGHNIDVNNTSKNSKSYRQLEIIQDINPSLIGTKYKCAITLDKYNEEKIGPSGEVILTYDTYYIETYKGLGN